MNLKNRLTAPGPKRILALDGGGIRGAITLGYLERMEKMLQKRHNNLNFRLCDYFDLIGGTSTGSIIAGGLAIGMSVTEIKEIYNKLSAKIFSRKVKVFKKLSRKFQIRALEKDLKNIFGEITMDSDQLKTGFCVITKRADTGNTWPIFNHPNGKDFKYTKDYLVRQVIRASTAAPTYFKPEIIDIGNGKKGAFVDGGVSMHNNPAFQLFLLATLQSYHLNWKTGADNLMIVSVGTGYWKNEESIEMITDNKLRDWAGGVISMLMNDAMSTNEMLLQYFSNSPTSKIIDRALGDLKNDLITEKPLLHYLRYNALLEKGPLAKLGFESIDPKDLYEMSEAKNAFTLTRIGEAAAKVAMKPAHFPASFDLKKNSDLENFDIEGFLNRDKIV